MPDGCKTSDCPMANRIKAMEDNNKRHGETHREIFRRLNAIEKDNAVQNAQYSAIMEKLDSLTEKHDKLNEKLEALEAKPGKRWDSLVEKTIWAVAGALIVFLLSKLGL